MANSNQTRNLAGLVQLLVQLTARLLAIVNEMMEITRLLVAYIELQEELTAQPHHPSHERDYEIDGGDVPDLEDGDDEALDELSDDEECPALVQVVANCKALPVSVIESANAELEATSPDDLADAAEVISDKCDQLTRLNQLLHAQLDWS
jgi:hypothetical protein